MTGSPLSSLAALYRVGYLDLEQKDPLFWERFESFEPDSKALPRLYRVEEFPKLDEPGLAHLEDFIRLKRLDLVFIDTLIRVRPSSRGKNATEADAELLAPVTKLAHKLNCHICVLAHTGKRREIETPLDMIAATSALAAAVDDVLVISMAKDNEKTHRYLHITGRHLSQPGSYLIERTDFGFRLLGEASEVLEGALQKQVLAYLRSSGARLTATELGKSLELKRLAVQKVLSKLAQRGLAAPCGSGKWATDHALRRK